MQVKVSQATSMLTKYLQAKLVPMMTGSPGIGKSQIVRDIAEQFNLKVIDLRLSQCDPTDLLGFPNIVGKRAGYVPMETFPIEGDALPAGYAGWMLFLDEMNGAVPAVQAAAYKLILDRMVGVHNLHSNVAIVCAGNLETDNGIVNPMPTPLQSRMVHLELVVDTNEWLEWASSNGINHRITSYVRFMPGNLYTFRPDHTDHTYGCPRTWEFSSRVLSVVDETSADFLPMLVGTLGEGLAREFVGFCSIYSNLPKLEDIVKAPESTKVPDEPSIRFALTGSISHNATKENFGSLIRYIKRLPVEFQVICLRETIRRNKAMLSHPAITQWIAESSTALY